MTAPSVSGIQRVPPEILEVILNLAVFQPANNTRIETQAELSSGRRWPDVFNYNNGPWSISRVCRIWRIITTSSPEFWQYFMLGNVNPGHPGQVKALQTWLTYTGTLKISFLISPLGLWDDEGRSDVFAFLLAKSSERWEEIQVINSSFQFWRYLFQKRHKYQFVSLTDVILLSEGDRVVYQDRTVAVGIASLAYHAFNRAPQLRSLVNREAIQSFRLSSYESQLTRFEGSVRGGLIHHLHVLSNASTLEWCRLEIDYTSVSSDVDFSFSLPELRTLEVHLSNTSERNSDPLAVENLSKIRHLHIPALESLVIQTADMNVPVPFQAFTEALRSSSCILRSLEISGRIICPEEEQGILTLLRSESARTIDRLCLWVCDKQPPLLYAIIIPHLVVETGSSEEFLPSLNTLEFRFTVSRHFEDMVYDGLVDAVRSRVTLRNVHFSLGLENAGEVYRYTSAFDEGCTRALRDTGLNVVVRDLVMI
ncbi:hypothetical protein AAF712_012941 [Marasmius tenuissimus]|uniref:F-box domain-containing protein n=1 Tax=Marasmius tenuissimus TaxID=585030 RepID=A0ABR2ZG17_9AGAR